MFVLSVCLVWLSLKRYRHARRELQARQIAEARLGAALAENRRLARENLRIQEVERKHLARELHDELGQYLNAIKLDAVSISDSGGDARFSTGASLAIIRSVDHVHRAVSDMIGRLRPVGLDELGLVDAIEHCVDHWRQRLPEMQFEVSVSGNFDGLSEPATLTVYRLIQEGLTNIYKHAQRIACGNYLGTLDIPAKRGRRTALDRGRRWLRHGIQCARFPIRVERHARTSRVVGRSLHADQRAGGGAQVHGAHPGECQRQRL